MDRVSLFKMSKQRCHSSIQNTERYAYLGLGHLYDAVVALNFQHTTNSEQKVASENDLKAVENGGRGWI